MQTEMANFQPKFDSNLSEIETKKYPIGEDYEVTKVELGVGLSGKVYKCIERNSKIERAVKVLSASKHARSEVKIHSQVCQHNNIVKIIDIYEDPNNLYIVMENMLGGELFDRIKEKEHFTEREAALLTRQICLAISHLHQNGIAHRDVKPENFLFATEDENSILKLIDFGFSKNYNESNLTSPCFTPFYVAPEVLTAAKYDKACDMWSVGIIAYIMLCGYPPFYPRSERSFSEGMQSRIKQGEYNFPKEDWQHISKAAKDMIQGLLTVDPKSRYTVEQVQTDPWLAKYKKVPLTPLTSGSLLNESKQSWPDVLQISLSEMRLKDEIILLPLSESNSLYKKRLKFRNSDESKAESEIQKCSS